MVLEENITSIFMEEHDNIDDQVKGCEILETINRKEILRGPAFLKVDKSLGLC